MRKIGLIILGLIGCWLASTAAHAADLNVPKTLEAGRELRVSVPKSGTLYVFGPSTAMKVEVKSGEEAVIPGERLRAAGRYTIAVGDSTATFFVVAGPASNVSFLARPSRIPAARKGVISGTAFVFDKFDNLVLEPARVTFTLASPGSPESVREESTKLGAAYTRMDSGRKDGPAHFAVSIKGNSVRRVVQQTASDPCTIRMKAEPSKAGILVSTDPIRDCAGNAVPDGTIVTFTAVSPNGKSTVDARIKRGIAQAQLPSEPGSTLSVASGVVMGNEIHWGGQ